MPFERFSRALLAVGAASLCVLASCSDSNDSGPQFDRAQETTVSQAAEHLAQELAALEARVAALEGALGAGSSEAVAEPSDVDPPEEPAAVVDLCQLTEEAFGFLTPASQNILRWDDAYGVLAEVGEPTVAGSPVTGWEFTLVMLVADEEATFARWEPENADHSADGRPYGNTDLRPATASEVAAYQAQHDVVFDSNGDCSQT